jgi:hypothetical protein
LAVGTRPDEGEVRLSFVEVIQADRQVDPHEGALADPAHDVHQEGADHARRLGPARRHPDQLVFDQLHAVVGPQDADLGHAVAVRHVELAARDRGIARDRCQHVQGALRP